MKTDTKNNKQRSNKYDLSLLKWIPTDDADTNFRVGVALKHSGFEFGHWWDWVDKREKMIDDEVDALEATWDSIDINYDGGTVTWGTIVWLAKENGYGRRRGNPARAASLRKNPDKEVSKDLPAAVKERLAEIPF